MSVRLTSKTRNTRTANRRKASARPRNQQLLEVRARREKAVRQRNSRIFNVACRFLLLLLMVGSLIYGGHVALQKVFYRNPEFTLRQIDIRVDGVMTREQILQAGELSEGMNIFGVKIGRLRNTLEAIPQVQSAVVERHLPDRIRIEIVERRPVAWLAGMGEMTGVFSPSDSMLLDARGIALYASEMRPEYSYMPIIYGIDISRIMNGEAVKSPVLQAALDLVHLTTNNYLQPPFHIRSIDLSKGYCLIVTDARHGRYTFGLDGLEEQLERLAAILRHTETTAQVIETANLMLKRNVPVTFVPVANEVEQESVKPKSKRK